jgi:hypothetical protein
MTRIWFDVLKVTTCITVWIKWGWLWGLAALFFAPVFWIYWLVTLVLNSGWV